MKTAIRFIDSVERVYRMLAAMPEMGAKRRFRKPDIGEVRMWVIQEFPNYLVFYIPAKNGVEILRILHRAEDYYKIFS